MVRIRTRIKARLRVRVRAKVRQVLGFRVRARV